MLGLNELRRHGRMTWTDAEQGWVAVPEEIVTALMRAGFAECKRAVTTSRRDNRPAGGVWQGLDPGTGVVASAVWVDRRAWPQATVFISVDGELLCDDPPSPDSDSDSVALDDCGVA
jgi:hypothetical protein